MTSRPGPAGRPCGPARVTWASMLAAATVAGCVPAADRPDGTDPVRVERTLPVMGTVLHLTSWADDEASARQANEAGRQAVLLVDSLMSHYRPDSEVSRLGSRAGTGTWTSLSPATRRVLAEALEWARRSGGAFDPTVGPLMEAWGFFQHAPHRPPPDTAASAAARVDFAQLTLDTANARARLERADMRVDLGALAKGYALDRALEAMARAGARSAMVDLGGNVAVHGRGPADDGTWRMGIRHPRREGRLMGTLRLAEGAVATSGDYEQMFEEDGVRYSHLMDPRTGEPARGVVAVTVAAPDGMTADALSTVLFVLGPDEGRAFLEREGLADRVTAVWIGDEPGAGSGDLPGRVVVHHSDAAGVELSPPPTAR
jgi:FAD:protein FMN transferase